MAWACQARDNPRQPAGRGAKEFDRVFHEGGGASVLPTNTHQAGLTEGRGAVFRS